MAWPCLPQLLTQVTCSPSSMLTWLRSAASGMSSAWKPAWAQQSSIGPRCAIQSAVSHRMYLREVGSTLLPGPSVCSSARVLAAKKNLCCAVSLTEGHRYSMCAHYSCGQYAQQQCCTHAASLTHITASSEAKVPRHHGGHCPC